MVSFIISFRAALCRALAAKACPIKLAASPTAAAIPPTKPPLANPSPILETALITCCIPLKASATSVFPISSNILDSSPAASDEAPLIVPIAPAISLNPFAPLSSANPFLNVVKIPSHLLLLPSLFVPNSLSRAFFNFSNSAGLFSIAFNCSGEMKVIPLASPLPERYSRNCLACDIRFCNAPKDIEETSPNNNLKKSLSLVAASACVSLIC